MGLPTSIPSGGDGLDRFSQPLPEPEVVREPTAEEKARAEFEEFQRWKREKMEAAQRAAEEKPSSPKPQQSQRTARPSVRQRNERPSGNPMARRSPKPAEPVLSVDEQQYDVPVADSGSGSTAGLRRRVDPKTGKSYFEIPKTKMGTDGRPELSIDIDIDDLNGEAENFLAHLRVVPSREEREALLAEKAEMARAQREARAKIDEELNEKLGEIPEPEKDPFEENQKRKRGLFGRAR